MQNLYRLANVMGLDANNPQHTVALKEAMHNISNQNEFIEYCRSHKDGVEYSTKVEKLDTLSTRYKKNFNNIPTQQLEEICQALAGKFKTAIQILRDNEEYLTDQLGKLKVEGEQYFTNKEVELLNATGKLNRLISLFELNTLYEALYHKSVQKTLTRQNNIQLTDNQQRVKRLIGGTA